MKEIKLSGIKKIGVISDTHIPERAEKIPEKIFDLFKDVDLILHAGDLCEMTVLKDLEKITKVIAVHGNMDESTCGELPEAVLIEIDNLKIGLTHSYGAPFGIWKRALEMFDEIEDIDCIIFGHSHRALNEVHDDILFFNPGSPTDRIFSPIRSAGILTIKDGKIKGEIVKV